MCGISGMLCRGNQTVSLQAIQTFNNLLYHRGPDSEGYWIDRDGRAALGHRRLSILDLSDAGKQPMTSTDGRWVMEFNGEIYNFIELRTELAGKGYSFSSDGDAQVLLAAWQEWGASVMQRLNGMWALAFYDVLQGELFLFRDRFGIKPLYYFQDDSRFLFASEVTAIHKFVGNVLTINRMVVASLLEGNGSYHGTDQTFLNEVRSLPGGHMLHWKDGACTVSEYYSIPVVQVPRSFREQAAQLRELLFDAVKIRLRSDVPVATCLSGGVDSGSIASIIAEMNHEAQDRFSHFSHRAFCASFKGSPIDETADAERIARQKQLTLDVLPILPPSTEELETALEQCDGPMYALAFYPIWKLYGYIKQQGITVTLDGQGPDEMLGGYNPLYEALCGAWQSRNLPLMADVYRTYAAQGESSQFSAKAHARRELRRFLRYRWLMLGQIYRRPLKKTLSWLHLYHYPAARAQSDGLRPARRTAHFQNALDKHLFAAFFQYPLPGILNQYDRCSMAHGVECRMPFMDYRVVEFVFSLPASSKVGGGYTKRVLREAMKGLLPDETRLNKRKTGFNAPIVDWYLGPLREWMLSQMDQPSFLNNPYFNGAEVRKEFGNLVAGDIQNWDHSWKFWPYVHLNWWMNRIQKYGQNGK